MKMTLDLPGDLVHQMKLQAVHEGRKIKDVAESIFRRGLAMPEGADVRPLSSRRVEIGEGGLPVIRCAPDAPASRMSAAELLALEQQILEEEDLQRAGISL